MHQHVGNWPGKTVEQAKGHFSHEKYDYDIIDLPGNYALSAHSIEEIVSRDFIVDDDSDVIINVVDAANLERNLYLTVQMMDLGANLVLELNMNDFAKKKDHIINIDLMSELLGFPVVEINAKTGEGIDDLFDIVQKQAEYPVDTSEKLAYGAELLPSYKIPSLKGVLLYTWEKVKGFIRKAGTVILACSVVLWALSTFPLG